MSEDRDYELGLLGRIISNPQLLRYAKRLSEYHFIYPYATKYLQVLQAAHKKVGSLPNLPEFKRLCEDLLLKENATPEDLDVAKEDAEYLYCVESTESSLEEVITFIQERELHAISSELKHFDRSQHDGDETLEKLEGRFRKLKSLRSNTHDLGENIWLPGKVTETLDSLDLVFGDLMVPTGFRRVDEDLWGGMAPQECYLVMGPSNLGKSGFCVNMSRNAFMLEPDGKLFKRRKRVAVLSTDDSPTLYKMRYYGSATNTPTRKHPGVSKLESSVSKSVVSPEGRWFSKFVPNQTFSMTDADEWIYNIQQSCRRQDLLDGIPPEHAGRVDALYVDYAEKMLYDGNKNDQVWTKLYNIVEAGQRIAMRYNMVVVLLTQGNSDMAKVNFGQLYQGGGGYDKIKPAAGVWIIGQTDDGRRLDPMEVYWHAAKDRRGSPNRLYPFFYDTTTQLIWENEALPVTQLSSHTKRNPKPLHETDGKAAQKYNEERVRTKTNRNYNPDVEDTAWYSGKQRKGLTSDKSLEVLRNEA